VENFVFLDQISVRLCVIGNKIMSVNVTDIFLILFACFCAQIQNLELELRTMSESEKTNYTNVVKSFKNDLKSLRKDFDRARHRSQRTALFGNAFDPANVSHRLRSRKTSAAGPFEVA